jgi:transcriptional regulator with XRE-family HTH domain
MIGAREHEALFERLEQLIALFPSQSAFARAVGIDESQPSFWSRRASQPRALTLMKVCTALNVDANWLLLGRGAPSVPDKTTIINLEGLRALKEALRTLEQNLGGAGGSNV